MKWRAVGVVQKSIGDNYSVRVGDEAGAVVWGYTKLSSLPILNQHGQMHLSESDPRSMLHIQVHHLNDPSWSLACARPQAACVEHSFVAGSEPHAAAARQWRNRLGIPGDWLYDDE